MVRLGDFSDISSKDILKDFIKDFIVIFVKCVPNYIYVFHVIIHIIRQCKTKMLLFCFSEHFLKI